MLISNHVPVIWHIIAPGNTLYVRYSRQFLRMRARESCGAAAALRRNTLHMYLQKAEKREISRRGEEGGGAINQSTAAAAAATSKRERSLRHLSRPTQI